MSAISLRKRYEAGVQRPEPMPETILPESRTVKSGAQKSMTQPRDWTAHPRIRQSFRPNLSEMNPLDRIPIIMEMDMILTGNTRQIGIYKLGLYVMTLYIKAKYYCNWWIGFKKG